MKTARCLTQVFTVRARTQKSGLACASDFCRSVALEVRVNTMHDLATHTRYGSQTFMGVVQKRPQMELKAEASCSKAFLSILSTILDPFFSSDDTGSCIRPQILRPPSNSSRLAWILGKAPEGVKQGSHSMGGSLEGAQLRSKLWQR